MNQKIKLAHLVTNFALGGAQDYLLTIIQNLDLNKFELFIFGRMEGERIAVLKNLVGVKYFDVPSLSRKISPIKDIKAIFQVYKLCKEHNIEILHTHSSKAGVVGRISARLAGRIATVHTIHGFSFHNFMTWGRKTFFIFLEKIMSYLTDVLLLVSETEKKIAIQLKFKPKRFMETIYNSVDFVPFEKDIDMGSFRKNLGISNSDIVIGFTGRFSQQKAIHILIKAFSNINQSFNNTKLLLVGDGVLRNGLELLCENLNIRDKVLITGFQSNVVPFYKIMDIFVMTSLWEGLSRCLTEAMYSKLPVIATDVGGTADAVRNGETGWLVKPNNVESVIISLNEAIKNPDLREKMSENGYKWARSNFNTVENTNRISQLYLKLLNN